ncbi:MAG: hypothetical protein EB053_05210 [Chlamydiae bacterium]|nr:hypothetical protein [Chlamydiota bacterium]
MVSVQTSASKIANCWQVVLSNSSRKKRKSFSTLIRIVDVHLPKKSLKYEMGRYRWTIRVEDVNASDSNVQEVDQVCRHQDLYKLRYEEIFYEKSLFERRISFIRLFRKIPEILQKFSSADLFYEPLKGIRLLNPKNICVL